MNRTLVLSPPDWNAVRPIYKKLSEEFHVLTSAYKIVLDEQSKVMLDHLIIGIDVTDHFIDELPTKQERDEITLSIIEFFQDDKATWDYTNASDLLIGQIEILKSIVQKLNVDHRFISASTLIFEFTELKRHTTNLNELIEFVKLEGRATAELPLSIMEVDPDVPFAHFFTKLCTLMGVADLIVDARCDYRNNMISIKPDLKLYWKLNRIMIREGLSILWNFPSKLSFILYCIRFSWSLLTKP